MNTRINTYDDLLQEKARLTALLQTQKDQVRQDFREIKEELTPIKTAVNFIGQITTKDSGNPLLNGAIDTMVDLVVKKLILGRAGWLTKLVVPFVIKNFASHKIEENKNAILRKIFSWFPKKKKEEDTQAESNGKMHPVTEEEED
jgi:hypothetical protein